MRNIPIATHTHPRLHRPEPQRRRPRTRSHVEQKQRFLLTGQLPQHLPQGKHSLVLLVVVVVHRTRSQLVHVEVRIVAGDDRVELLVAEHGEPLGLHDPEEAAPEEPGLLLDLLVAFEVRVAEDELHLVFAA